MCSGIYEIKNKLNNHRYIGSSVDIYKRFGEHKRLLYNNSHHSFYLQNAWDKYGENNFEFNILEKCDPVKDTLLFIEQKYLDLNPEYNICKCARNTQGIIFSEDRRNKISLANSNRIIKDSTRSKHKINSINSNWNKIQRKPVYMLNAIDGSIIMEFNSLMSAARYTGHINHRVGIKRVLNNSNYTAYGYKWKLKNTNNDL